jgi:hypothetical protein
MFKTHSGNNDSMASARDTANAITIEHAQTFGQEDAISTKIGPAIGSIINSAPQETNDNKEINIIDDTTAFTGDRAGSIGDKEAHADIIQEDIITEKTPDNT